MLEDAEAEDCSKTATAKRFIDLLKAFREIHNDVHAATLLHIDAESQCEADNIFPVLTKRPVCRLGRRRLSSL